MLTDRKLRILQAIINDFVLSAHPVGSRTISKKYLVGTSSATIRNEMADLEELGLLLQPHTSAGRIPSDQGYRFFVDRLMETVAMDIHEMHRIHNLLYNRQIKPEELAKRALRLLADMTGMVAVVATPDLNKAKLENLRLIQVSPSKLLMILVTDQEIVRTVEMSNTEISSHRLQEIESQMLHEFKGKNIEEMDLRAFRSMKDRLGEIDYFLPALKEAFKSLKGTQVFIEGASQLALDQGIRSPDHAQELVSFLSDHEQVERLIRSCIDEVEQGELAIGIGSELGSQALSDFSVVAQHYDIGSDSRGFVAVLGPKHMDYEQVCSVVRYIAKSLSETFSGINL